MAIRSLKIGEFHGLDTRWEDFHRDAGTSPGAVNFICREGGLERAAGTTLYGPRLPEEGARLMQAFLRDENTHADRRVLLAAGAGRLYALEGGEWRQIGEGYASDDWRGVNYRGGETEMMLMVNGQGGILRWNGQGDAQWLRPTQGGEEIAFSQLTLLYERLWGAVRADAPDRIYWSDSFDPENWEPDYDAPDSGGGFLDVATFDGSRIRAVAAAFDDVLVFKDKSVHRISGTYPGEFSLSQVYGSEGTLAPRTIAHTADRLYFLGAEGLCVYNGMTVAALAHSGDGRMDGIWKRMNRGAMEKACAAIHGETLYLALPLDGAEENSHVVEYRLDEKTWSLVSLAGVRDWLVIREGTGERLLCLVGRRVYAYGRGDALAGELINACWISPELAPGALASRKTVRFLSMAVNARPAAGGECGVRLSLISGGRERSCVVYLPEGLSLIRRRLRIRGRSVRFRIENIDGCYLSLPDGMEIELEEDEAR